ncbi:hypothetical protein OG948_33555 [Embleya sp. NBC_00888]|uniref:hypothetical protein n=1 Tax=Embleya sp. NBC_00888 TaxID=2975960 RepID=UPI00386C67C7|nr:hypothetical protein OG948_33555 [Embleya sp. NBC_00888]
MTSPTYQGPATIVVDEVEIPVSADLRVEAPSQALPGWRGSLQADSPNEDLWPVAVRNAPGNPSLRLPDGSTGEFVATNMSMGSGSLRIVGSGPAPF